LKIYQKYAETLPGDKNDDFILTHETHEI